jgi:hypothetical protein
MNLRNEEILLSPLFSSCISISVHLLIYCNLHETSRLLRKDSQLGMYVYDRGGPHSAPAPRPSLIYSQLGK